MKLLVLILSFTSSLYLVFGTSINHHHRHHHNHHIHHSNPSIALPPDANSPSLSPTIPIAKNSTIALTPPPHVSTIPLTKNSTNYTSTPPTHSSRSNSSISPSPSYVFSTPITKNSTNSTSTPTTYSSNIAPSPSYVFNTPMTKNSTNSTSTSPTYSSNSSSITPSPSYVSNTPMSKNSTNSTSSNSSNIPPSPSSYASSSPMTNNSTNSTSTTPTHSNSSSIAPSPYVYNIPVTKNSTNFTSTPPTGSRSSSSIAPAPSPSSIVVYNVRSFGAIGDGVADDTEAFKSAWDSACQTISGIILVPRGYNFMIKSSIFVGPCQNGILFQIDGTIMPPDGPDAWPVNNSKRQWLVFYRVEGMIMQGGGLIDGKGQKWWDLPCKPHKWVNGTTKPGPCDSPVALRFFMSSNITVHGLRIRNSPQFHFRFDGCHNIIVDSISISSPALSPNTDGIHVENTNNVGIYNSVISNGDDCISIGAGTLNVDIRNVTCGPSHGISIGSLGKSNSRACVTNITVTNAIIKNSDNGLRIKTWQGGSGSVSSISFNNIKMDTVRNPIIIDQYYCLSKPCENQTSNIFISDITYSGVKGTYDVRSPPVHLGCSDSVPCTNITLVDIELLPAMGNVIADAYCWNVYGGSRTLTIPPVSCLLEGLPRLIMDYDSEKCY